MLKDQGQVISASIFRAYDIRGIVGETLTEESVFLIGKAVGSLVISKGESQLAIARDGRVSGPLLLKALIAGIVSSGCDVVDIGMVPTPLLYYATYLFEDHSGVMLTGSHNPADYNGLKIVIKGAILAEGGLTELYQNIVQNKLLTGAGLRHEVNIADRYINHVVHNITVARKMTVVVDAGNGVTGVIAPMLFRALGCEVHELFCEIDGTFPNHHPDPSQPENMQDLIRVVREKHADVGLAFDGDGDRLGVVTNTGEIIFSDRLLMLFAKTVLANHPKAKIIYDVKCTDHLEKLIRSLDGEPIMWKTGHSLIKAKLAELNAQLGGEMSGHFFFKDRWYGFDDALYAGARLIEILSKQPLSCDAVFASIPNSINTPELKLMVEEDEKFVLMQQLVDQADFADAKDVMTLDGLRVSFENGWGLVRPSNTSACLIFRFEALNEPILQKIQQIFRTWLLSVKPDLVLPF